MLIIGPMLLCENDCPQILIDIGLRVRPDRLEDAYPL